MGGGVGGVVGGVGGGGGWGGGMNDTMERAKLKSELDDMRRLVDRIPPEILAELKRQQRQHGKER